MFRRHNTTYNRRKYITRKTNSIFGFEHDEEGTGSDCPKAPFMLPDSYMSQLHGKLVSCKLTSKTYAKEKSKNRQTFGKKKRCYIRGRLYRDTATKTVYTADCSTLSGSGIVINVATLGPDGLVLSPEHKKKNQYCIRASRVEDEKLLSSIVQFGAAMNARLPRGNARSHAQNIGSMTVFGDRMHLGERVTYKSITEGLHETEGSLHLLQQIKVMSRTTARRFAQWMKKNPHTCWRGLLERLRKSERDQKICPAESMGGKRGVTSSGVISTDLGNEAHFDVLDDGESVSVFVEVIPGLAKNWYLCFPNMEIQTQGKVFYGLRIKLCHGAIVNWDGRVMKHFTSITETGHGNHVYGYFFCPSTRLIETKTQLL